MDELLVCPSLSSISHSLIVIGLIIELLDVKHNSNLILSSRFDHNQLMQTKFHHPLNGSNIQHEPTKYHE